MKRYQDLELREQNIPATYVQTLLECLYNTLRVSVYGSGIDTNSARTGVFYLQILVECELKHL